jgi:hypothetical protein
VTYTVSVPTAAPRSQNRRPAYVSPSTYYIQVSDSGPSGTSPYTARCTSVCTVSFNATVGQNTFAVDLTDESSQPLSIGTSTQAVVANQTNVIAVTLNPVVKSMSLQYINAPAGTPAHIPLSVVAQDIDGNTITAPGVFVNASDNPIVVTVTEPVQPR